MTQKQILTLAANVFWPNVTVQEIQSSLPVRELAHLELELQNKINQYVFEMPDRSLYIASYLFDALDSILRSKAFQNTSTQILNEYNNIDKDELIKRSHLYRHILALKRKINESKRCQVLVNDMVRISADTWEQVEKELQSIRIPGRLII